jgi:hypothetical protein
MSIRIFKSLTRINITLSHYWWSPLLFLVRIHFKISHYPTMKMQKLEFSYALAIDQLKLLKKILII